MAENENMDDIYVEFTDEEDNVYTYLQELIIPVGDEKFALLVAVDEEGIVAETDGEEEDVIVAKIVLDENGEESYIEPTDEEYEKVQAAYDAMFEDEE
jgi:hypothetical protein